MQVTCPHKSAPKAIAASAAALLYYHDASNSAELEPTFRQGADTWAKHLVTSAGSDLGHSE